MCRTEQLDDGEWIEDEDQVMQLKANFIISAFGSGLYDPDGMRIYFSGFVPDGQRKKHKQFYLVTVQTAGCKFIPEIYKPSSLREFRQ